MRKLILFTTLALAACAPGPQPATCIRDEDNARFTGIANMSKDQFGTVSVSEYRMVDGNNISFVINGYTSGNWSCSVDTPQGEEPAPAGPSSTAT